MSIPDSNSPTIYPEQKQNYKEKINQLKIINMFSTKSMASNSFRAFEFSLFLSTNKVLTRFIICTESFQAQSKCIDSDKFCTIIDRFSAVES